MAITLAALFACSQTSYAFKLNGKDFTVRRGKPVLNVTKSESTCMGPGFCIGTVEFNNPSAANLSVKIPDGKEVFNPQENEFGANLVNYQGNAAIEVSAQFYETFNNDFKGNLFSLNGDWYIDASYFELLKLSPIPVINSGNYRVIVDPASQAILILITEKSK